MTERTAGHGRGHPVWALVGIVVVLGCGAGTGAGGGAGGGGIDGDGGGGESGPSWSHRAAEAWAAGDVEGAGRAAANGLQLSAGDDGAAIIAARVALARGDGTRAIAALREAHAPASVRMRARARVITGDWAGAARDLASVEGREPEDGWAEAMLPIARVVAEQCGSPCRTHRISGAERSGLPWVGRGILPIVEITIDGRTVNALVATSADVTLISRTIRREGGLATRMELGGVVVEAVPVLPRDLAPVGQSLGLELGAVIGMDLLPRLRATLDARERWLVVRTSGSDAAEDAAAVPYLTLDGGFVAVRGELGGTGEGENESREGVAAGMFGFDTAGGFPLAITEATVRALGHDPAQLPRVQGAPSESIRETPAMRVRLGEVQIDDVPGIVGLVPPDLTEMAGMRLSGLVGMHLLASAKISFDPEGRRILFE